VAMSSSRADAAYRRVAAVRTADEHARISRARGVVLGAGGTGWLAAQFLACLGVGHLTLIDADCIELANLNRLVGVTQDDVAAGRPKVERLATILREQDPTREVTAIPERFPSDNSVAAVERADFVVCAVDHPPTRLAVQRLCARHLVPALDVGSAVYMDDARAREDERHGHAWLYIPGHACWLHMGLQQQGIESDTLRDARRAAGYVVDDPRESPGSVQTLNAVVVSFGLTLLEAHLTGRRPAHQVVLYEERVTPALTFKLRQYGVGADADCPLCGLAGVVGKGGNPFPGAGVPLAVPMPPPLMETNAA
jgi:ThiF family